MGFFRLILGFLCLPMGLQFPGAGIHFVWVLPMGFQIAWSKHILLLTSRTPNGAEESQLRTKSENKVAKILRGKGVGWSSWRQTACASSQYFKMTKSQFPTTRQNVNKPKTQGAQNRKTQNANAETTNEARAVTSKKTQKSKRQRFVRWRSPRNYRFGAAQFWPIFVSRGFCASVLSGFAKMLQNHSL